MRKNVCIQYENTKSLTTTKRRIITQKQEWECECATPHTFNVAERAFVRSSTSFAHFVRSLVCCCVVALRSLLRSFVRRPSSVVDLDSFQICRFDVRCSLSLSVSVSVSLCSQVSWRWCVRARARAPLSEEPALLRFTGMIAAFAVYAFVSCLRVFAALCG